MTRVEKIGNATLYLGDCMQVLPTLATAWAHTALKEGVSHEL